MISFTLSSRLLSVAVFAGLLLAGLPQANAQCPAAAFCNPTNPQASNLTFGMGIRNVTLGPLNHTTQANSGTGTQNGYQDFSCTTGATLTTAVSYPISITTGPIATENVRVYIDYNNDGVFSVPAELAFSSNNALVHTGSIIVPATAVLNTPLRMRVVSEFTGASALPSPCMALEFGQAEDYHVIVQPNTAPAQPDFTTTEPYTCDGTVSFTDLSQNAPTTWSWDFGDPGSGAANTSSSQNPSHTFSAPGVYTVSLTACNANGCNIITKTNYITYNTDLPVAASCTPATLGYCCGYGIYNVTFAGINNSSADGIAGYQDFTCPVRTNLVEGFTYPISITTSQGNNQNTGVWIDYNNDGIFSAAENVLTSLNSINPTGSVTIPSGAVMNTPLRMRVVSDFAGSPISACGNVQNGQAEDYTVTIVANTFPPVPAFGIGPFADCDTVRQFINNTQLNLSSPATTYMWHFGDGSTSTAANPTHAYSSATGTYTVTLVACNSFGCDTLATPYAVTINNPCLTYCMPANNNNASQWIGRVQYGTIDNQSGQGANGYTNFSHISTPILRGDATNFTVTLGTLQQRTISIWIDYNQNGIFEPAERVFNGFTQVLPSGLPGVTGTITIPVGLEVGAARMRVIMRNVAVNTDPCISNTNNTDVEDYTIILQNPPPVPPAAAFTANQAGICNGTVSFQDQSLHLPTSWTWDFGDGSPAVTTQNPTHTYQITTPATYTVTLTACNSAGCSTVTMPDLVNITVPCTIPYCPSNGHSNSTQHISRVTAVGIDNPSAAAPNGYSDFTAQSTEMLIGAFSPFSLRVANGTESWAVSVWIDFNQNAVFEPNERLFIGQTNALAGGGFGVSGIIVVPFSAVPGPTRMRIIGRAGTTNTDPCAMNLPSGETEDYTVNLVTVASNDVGVESIVSPVSGCTLSSTEQVCIVVRNYGTDPQTNIPVQFAVGPVQSPVETIAGPIAPGATTTYCFTATANLSATLNYNVVAQTLLANDAQAANNTRNTLVSSYPLPNANFTYSGSGLTYSFLPTSTNPGSTYSWNFGNGNTAVTANPTHTFAAGGAYTVTLTATSSSGCVFSTSQTIAVTGLPDELEQRITLFPNPSAGEVTISFPEEEAVIVEVINSLGQQMHRSLGTSGSKRIDLAGAASGMYTVKIYLRDTFVVRKLVLQ